MKRSNIQRTKSEAQRLLDRIDTMEAMAGWTRYTATGGAYATSQPHPDDSFNAGQYVAAVKRASLDLSRELAKLRKS